MSKENVSAMMAAGKRSTVLPMDDADRRAIELDCTRLVACYANLVDAAEWEQVTALFTDSAVVVRPTVPDQPIIGRPAILASFAARPPRVTRHFCANIVIDVASMDEARGECASLLFTGSAAPIVGTFRDRFVRTPAGWRFAERRGSLLFAVGA